jgi:hypothetical protein
MCVEWSHISEGLISIYNNYIHDLNLSNETKQELDKIFGANGTDVTLNKDLLNRMVEEQRVIVFDNAVDEIRNSLQTDSFTRYINSKEFKNSMEEYIPYLSYKELVFSQFL